MSRYPSLHAAAMAVVAALLTGCGTINVAVDVLDPEHVRVQMDDVRARKLYREIQASVPDDIGKQVDERFEAYAREIRNMAAAIRKAADALPAGRRVAVLRSADMLEQGVSPSGTYRLSAMQAAVDLESLSQAIREEATRLKYVGQGPLPERLRQRLFDFQARDKALRAEQVAVVRFAKMDLQRRVSTAASSSAASAAASAPVARAEAASAAASKAVTSAAAAPLAEVAAPAAAAVSAASRSIIGGGSLAATEFAYVVASASDQRWQPDYNRAFADTKFGSADIVIKLNSTADFSVKGMLFDASTVANMASKVLTQTVLLGAQMAGVPVATATTGTKTGGDALSKSSSDLAGADALLAERDALVAAQKRAIRSLARALLAGTPQLAAGGSLADKPVSDEVRKALHDSIESSFLELKNLLSLQGLK
jgi:trimeric autotransporter adhesin